MPRVRALRPLRLVPQAILLPDAVPLAKEVVLPGASDDERSWFEALKDAIVFVLKANDPENFGYAFDALQKLKLSEHLEQQKEKFMFPKSLYYPHVRKRVQSFDEDKWQKFSFASYLLILSKETASYLVVVHDFFLCFLDSKDISGGTGPDLWAKASGSRVLSIESSNLRENPTFFSDLAIDTLPIRVMYHLVPRFVQFTGAKWDFDCLATKDKEIAVNGNSWPDPPTHKLLCVLFHSVGMKVFLTTILFRRFNEDSESETAASRGEVDNLFDDDVAIPEIDTDSVNLDENSSHITGLLQHFYRW